METQVIQISGSTLEQRECAVIAVKAAFAAAAEHFGVVELAQRICAPHDEVVLKKAA